MTGIVLSFSTKRIVPRNGDKTFAEVLDRLHNVHRLQIPRLLRINVENLLSVLDDTMEING